MINQQKLRKLAKLIEKKEKLLAKIRNFEVSIYLDAHDSEITACQNRINEITRK